MIAKAEHRVYMREPLPKARLLISSLIGSERTIERLSPSDTLHRILEERCSISRFGDGELRYCLKKKGIAFQPFRSELANRLLNAILIPKNRVLTCFNNIYRDTDYPEFVVAYGGQKPYDHFRSVHFENDIGARSRGRERRAYIERWLRVLRKTRIRTFGEASVFRLSLYVQEYERGDMESVKNDFRSLFAGRRILFICPRSPHEGDGFKELEPRMREFGLDGAEYHYIPEIDAAAVEDEIVDKILTTKDVTDVFIQAGPLASVLAHELSDKIEVPIVDAGALNTQLMYL